MTDRIEIANKSDRDLLVLTVQHTNLMADRLDILNGNMAKVTEQTIRNCVKVQVLMWLMGLTLTTIGGLISYLIFH